MKEHYQPELIEQQVQQLWEERECFKVIEDSSKEKFYCLAMFPYPSGKLHMGHVRNYTISDVIARYQRMLGKNVLQPMGWDAFGLPAENAAIQNQVAPAQWTYQNIDVMREQFKQMGFAYDWQRELATCNPKYYRWEQWFFTKLFEKGLVYKKNAMVNWDPVDQTILANEQVIDGRGWRSGALVERREIPQWFLKITAYAEELLKDLDKLEHWPEEVKTMQRNWIGRSEGMRIHFDVEVKNTQPLEVFTTRPDTLMGVTFLAIAPQHPLAGEAAKNNPQIQKFLDECRQAPTTEAAIATQEKRGINTGIKAHHPITNELIPIWIANFVVMEYGTGAVMAVPANDERDFEFAQKYQLPLREIFEPTETRVFGSQGILINADQFTDLTSTAAHAAIADHLIKNNKGTRIIQYRLRDWSVSRQRYWGTPVPMINCANCGTMPVLEKDLPVILPEQVNFTGATSPLKTMPEFYQTTCPTCGSKAERETDTFDTFMESSWYYARFACKDQDKTMLDERAKYWTPVDQYVGGIEHAVMHLLYARFYHKLLRDAGLLNSDEPFIRLLTQGMVLKDGAKMSKSKGNVVDPNQLINKYGADTVRLFIIFAAPPEQSLEWSDSGVEGSYRFLKRLWNFAYTHHAWLCDLNKTTNNSVSAIENNELRALRRQIHEILQQANYDFERQQFNTVVSGGMKLLNLLQTAANELTTETKAIIQEGFSILLRLLAPIVPHITQTLWKELNFGSLAIDTSWPKAIAAALKTDEIQLVVQINGKLRGHIVVATNANEDTIKTTALKDAQFEHHLQDKVVKKIIVVPGKLVNIVV